MTKLPHDGGPCPVAPETRVRVWLREGYHSENDIRPAIKFNWEWSDWCPENDIIFYEPLDAQPAMFSKFRRSQIAELRPYVAGEPLTDVSISTADKEAGSPKLGDMIARNPKNHADQWLVAAKYFADNFEPIGAPAVDEDWQDIATAPRCVSSVTHDNGRRPVIVCRFPFKGSHSPMAIARLTSSGWISGKKGNALWFEPTHWRNLPAPPALTPPSSAEEE